MTMLVVYTPFLTGQLNNADGFINGVIAHKKNYDWENSQGRFLIGWFDRWRDRMVQPSLIIGVCLMLLCLVVSVIWYIFDCYSMVEKLCIGAILVFSPSIADLFTYYYCADSYMLSYLLAVIAAALLIKGEKKKDDYRKCGVANYFFGNLSDIHWNYGFTLLYLSAFGNIEWKRVKDIV